MGVCAYQASATTWRSTQVSPDSCNEDYVILTVGEYQEYRTLKGMIIEPVEVFDPVTGSAVFAAFFSAVFTLWIIARSSGLILEAIKNW